MRFLINFFALILSTAVIAQQAPSTESSSCPVTVSKDHNHRNDFLGTSLLPDGRMIFKPGGPGFVEDDGSLGIKWPWWRLIEGQLAVGGRRLDREAPPARAYISFGYGNIGFQPIYLVFPTPGCWQITGGVSGHSLTFIIQVEKVGDGPDWRRNGPNPGWRTTTDWNDPGVVAEPSR